MSIKSDLQAKRRSILDRIARKASEVRKLQKDYFRTRDEYVLQASKTAERELDVILTEFERVERQLAGREAVQESLFRDPER